MMLLNPELSARNGRVLRVIVVCRISTEHQDERSLQDQEALYRDWLAKHWDGQIDVTVLASQGSAESLVRDDYLQLCDSVESGQIDLVLTEDLGRICRRVHAHIFCESCEDAATRCIALNDHVDTAHEDWRLNSFFAVMRHEAYNKDTSNRIRRSKRNRFQNGGPWQCEIYGYIKPPGCTSINDVQKDPAAVPIVERIFSLLEDGASFAEVSDWLNSEGICPGPYARQEQWTGTMLGQFVRNPVLKGVKEWNRTTTKRQNSTGKRRSVDAPPESLLTYDCPHLAFVDADRFDRLMRALRQRNQRYGRKRVDGQDPRKGVPKQRTTWPSQHMQCGICGETFVFGGHGRAGHIFCRGVPRYTCWNVPSLDAVDVARRIMAAIYAEIERLPDFDTEFLELVRDEARQLDFQRRQKLAQVEARLQKFDREEAHLTAAIRESGSMPALMRSLADLESQREAVLADADQLGRDGPGELVLPSMDEIRRHARDAVANVAPACPEFNRQIRRIVTRLIAVPYRLTNGGAIDMRAFVEFTGSAWRPVERVPKAAGR
jgi:site-specific DNA recombinase